MYEVFCFIHCQHEKTKAKIKPSQNDARLFRNLCKNTQYLHALRVYSNENTNMENSMWTENKLLAYTRGCLSVSYVLYLLFYDGWCFSTKCRSVLEVVRLRFLPQRCSISHTHKLIFKASFDRTTKMFSLHIHTNTSIYLYSCGIGAYTNTHWRSICRSRIMYACTIFGYIQNRHTHIHIHNTFYIFRYVCIFYIYIDAGVSKCLHTQRTSKQASVKQSGGYERWTAFHWSDSVRLFRKAKGKYAKQTFVWVASVCVRQEHP